MPDPGARASASVPGRSVRPGRSPPVPGRGDPFGPVRDGVGDRYRRRLPGAHGLKFLVVARLPSGDGGQAPDVEKAAQLPDPAQPAIQPMSLICEANQVLGSQTGRPRTRDRDDRTRKTVGMLVRTDIRAIRRDNTMLTMKDGRMVMSAAMPTKDRRPSLGRSLARAVGESARSLFPADRMETRWTGIQATLSCSSMGLTSTA